MRFEITIPPGKKGDKALVVPVQAANWMSALKEAMKRLGVPAIPSGKALCEIRENGSIVVLNPYDDQRFFIRPLHEEEAPPVESPSTTPAPHATLAYLEAALQDQTRPPKRTPSEIRRRIRPPTRHPCLVMQRSDIDARLDSMRGTSLQHSTPRTGDSQPALQVVEVEPHRAGAMSALRVDLDALRESTSLGFDVEDDLAWLRAPLRNVVDGVHSLEEFAERILRLTLAALPCRLALLLRGSHPVHVIQAVGEGAGQFRGRKLPCSGGILEEASREQLAMVLSAANGDRWSVQRLQADLGRTLKVGLIAPIVGRSRPWGQLVLVEPSSDEGFGASSLLTAIRIGQEVSRSLHDWMT